MTANHPLIGKRVINTKDGDKEGIVFACAYHAAADAGDWAGFVLLVVLDDATITEWIACDCVGGPA